MKCEQCKTLISTTEHGALTECEHYKFKPLEDKPRNERTSFSCLLTEYSRVTNPVTKAVYRDILKGRLDSDDLS